MALTHWNPNTKTGRGNVAVGIAPVIADIDMPMLAEINTGVGLDCSITTFNGTSSASSETIDWLCDPASEQLPGSIAHTIDDLMIKATGQEDQELIDALSIGDTVYVWRRDGIEHDTPLASGQMVWVWKVIITSIDPVEASNVYIGINAHVNVQARSRTAVSIVEP